MRKRQKERRQEIAVAALKILGEQGPQRLTAQNIGAMIGMDGSSLFRHFNNKSEILHAAIDEFETVLDASIPDSEPSWDALHDFFIHRLTIVQARPEIIQLAFNQHLLEFAGQEEHGDRVRQIVQRTVAFIRLSLEKAQKKALISDAIPAIAQVWVVGGMLRGASLGSMEPRPDPEQAWLWLQKILQTP